MSNPFETLGMPQALLENFYANRNAEDIKKFSRSVFKLLSMYMHPDKGGDTATYQELVEALEEITDDPLTVADYYLGESVGRDISLKDTSRQQHEKQKRLLSILELSFTKIDSKLIVPWMSGKEVVYGLGNAKSPSGLVLVSFSKGNKPELYSLNSNEAPPSASVEYDEKQKKWLVKYSPEVKISNLDDQSDNETIEILSAPLNKGENPENIIIVGAINEENYYRAYHQVGEDEEQKSSSLALLDKKSHKNISTEALSWVGLDTAWWRDYFSTEASPNDALVLVKEVVNGVKFSVTATPIAIRDLE